MVEQARQLVRSAKKRKWYKRSGRFLRIFRNSSLSWCKPG